MTQSQNITGLQLRSLVKPDGELELSLQSVDTPAPARDEVVIRVEAGYLAGNPLALSRNPPNLSRYNT